MASETLYLVRTYNHGARRYPAITPDNRVYRTLAAARNLLTQRTGAYGAWQVRNAKDKPVQPGYSGDIFELTINTDSDSIVGKLIERRGDASER